MKIRIFALAKELGLDSKELIEYCNQAGVPAKNSALASITPEQRDKVVGFIEGRQRSGGSTAVAEYPSTPVREEFGGTGGKVRQIVAPPRQEPRRPARPVEVEEDLPEAEEAEELLEQPEEDEAELAPSRAESAGADSAGAEADVEAEPVEAEPLAETEPALQEPVAEETAVKEPAVKEPAAEVADRSKAAEAPAAGLPEAAEAPKAPPKAPQKTLQKPPAAGPRPAAEPEKPEVHRPEDYIAPTGGRASSRMIRDMEMKPRGNVAEPKAKRPKKDKPARPPGFPFVAAPPPEISTPQPKRPEKAEAPAQKPVMRLSPDMLTGQGPLRKQLERHVEEKEQAEKQGKTLKELRKRRDREQEKEDATRGRTKSRRPGRRSRDEDDARGPGRRVRKPSRRRGPIEYKSSAEVELPITVRSLSEAMGRPAKELMSALFRAGVMAQINDILDEEQAQELAIEFGVELRIKRGRDLEEELAAMLEPDEDEENLVERPPVVTILGHVDHGKTSLLDKIRSANVAAGEAGGITQHIASYQVEHQGKRITFVDTPGHAAFGEMRARGANVTDIIVLVVAADDSVMPQTVECISHAKAAGVPIIVAMNKIDLPDHNEQRVLQDLAQHEIIASEWGGEVEVIRTSAVTGQGIDDLLETILLTAELEELTANPEREAVGVCLEAFRSEGRGVIAWLIVQRGTLRVGDVVLCGGAYGRVRAMYDDRDRAIDEAGPSQPVKITGLDIIPGAGDHFFVMHDLEEARVAAEDRRHSGRAESLTATGRPKTLEDLLGGDAGVKDLPLILKADTPGSLEALRGEITKFEHPEVRVELIHEGVGGVNESDVSLAAAAGAIIVAFHVVPEDRAAQQADRTGVEIRRYDIIYEVTEHIRQALEGLLEPERIQETTGRAIVLQTFKISRVGSIAGCRVLNGTIERNHRVHVIRDQKILGEYGIASLKREKDDVREVREGMECGIRLDGFNDVKEGDIFEGYVVKEVKRTLD